jgi:hypothetical protein
MRLQEREVGENMNECMRWLLFPFPYGARATASPTQREANSNHPNHMLQVNINQTNSLMQRNKYRSRLHGILIKD